MCEEKCYTSAMFATALYLHVPFCPHICPYCDFHKMRRHEGLVARYLQRLEQEAVALHQHYPEGLRSIYLGGGTPSHLQDSELERIFTHLERLWGLDAEEITLEADPLTFTPERLRFFQSLGINRLSIGMQSTQDSILKFLGRQHNGTEGLQAVQWALEAGFNVSADLITAITGQDSAYDLHTLAQTGVPHISVYSLTIEPYTSFARRGVQVSEDKDFQDYQLARDILASYGFQRYEVSSHAKAGYESCHNQSYWHGDYFLALGPSAAGFVPQWQQQRAEIGVRYVNPPIKTWLQGQEAEILAVNNEDFLLEQLLTGLRTRRGVDVLELEQRTHINLLEKYQPLIEKYQQHGLLLLEPPFLRASDAGFLQLNGIIKSFYQG